MQDHHQRDRVRGQHRPPARPADHRPGEADHEQRERGPVADREHGHQPQARVLHPDHIGRRQRYRPQRGRPGQPHPGSHRRQHGHQRPGCAGPRGGHEAAGRPGRPADGVTHRGDQHGEHQGGRRPQPGHLPAGRPPQRPGHPARDGGPHIRALGRQRPAGTGQPGDGGLGQALRIAAGEEVTPASPAGADPVPDRGGGLVQQHPVRIAPANPQAQFGLLAAERRGADPAEAGREAADIGQHLPAERHVRADEVADLATLAAEPAHALVGAADHPVELRREPAWPAFLPVGADQAADPQHLRVSVPVGQPGDPVGVRHRVVVEESHDVTLGTAHPGVARPGQSRCEPVRDDDRPGQGVHRPAQQPRAVVHHQDDLQRGNALPAQRRHRPGQVIPPLLGITADNDRDRELAGAGWRAGGSARPRIHPGRIFDGGDPASSRLDRTACPNFGHSAVP